MTHDEAPLTDAELQALLAWQRRMRLALLVSGLLLVVWLVAIAVLPDEPWVSTLAVLFATPLVASGIAIQYSGRCPRCGYRIGLRSRLDLPRSCPGCGASFSASGTDAP